MPDLSILREALLFLETTQHEIAPSEELSYLFLTYNFMMNSSSPYSDDYYEAHIRMMIDSFHKHTGTDLLVPESGPKALSLGVQVRFASFILASHGIELDPVFNYANKR